MLWAFCTSRSLKHQRNAFFSFFAQDYVSRANTKQFEVGRRGGCTVWRCSWRRPAASVIWQLGSKYFHFLLPKEDFHASFPTEINKGLILFFSRWKTLFYFFFCRKTRALWICFQIQSATQLRLIWILGDVLIKMLHDYGDINIYGRILKTHTFQFLFCFLYYRKLIAGCNCSTCCGRSSCCCCCAHQNSRGIPWNLSHGHIFFNVPSLLTHIPQ